MYRGEVLDMERSELWWQALNAQCTRRTVAHIRKFAGVPVGDGGRSGRRVFRGTRGAQLRHTNRRSTLPTGSSKVQTGIADWDDSEGENGGRCSLSGLHTSAMSTMKDWKYTWFYPRWAAGSNCRNGWASTMIMWTFEFWSNTIHIFSLLYFLQ